MMQNKPLHCWISDQTSRASILPLDWLSPSEPLKVLPDANCLGVASELVRAPADIRPVLDLLLGQVLVVRNRSAARHVLAGLPKHARAVTLRGEVFHATGEVVAGKPNKTAVLGRPRQRRELQEILADADRQIAVMESETDKIDRVVGRCPSADPGAKKRCRSKTSAIGKCQGF